MSVILPLAHPKPNAQQFINILMGRKPQVRTPLVEYIIDDVVMKSIAEELLGRRWIPYGADRESQKEYLDAFIEFWYRLGYDFVRFELGMESPESQLVIPGAAPGSPKSRECANEHQRALSSWDDFEQLQCPHVEDFDFFPYEYLNCARERAPIFSPFVRESRKDHE